MKIKVLFGIAGLLSVLAACATPRPQPPQLAAATATPIATRTPTFTPLPTATPTATPTPTPTARPMVISDNLRASRLTTPVAQRGAPCGVVDLLDFPLDPPEGQEASARWPFGRYSERYQGIHAGEDWVYNFGSSLGKPVYTIGHGQVLYAEPWGWGGDKGTIIIRHVFADGSTIMSFYGHLDPPSVVLRAGDCVKRGDQIGLIGQPTTRPHLHFEIRSIFPDQPGPGYWSVDPTLAGWKAPSDYIWLNRMSTSPGVKWTRVFTGTDAIGVGTLRNGWFAAFENQQLFAFNADTGTVQWRRPFTETVDQITLDATGQSIYVSTVTGTLRALDMTGAPQWSIELDASALMALPGSGLAAQAGDQLIGLSPTSDRLWQVPVSGTVFDHVIDRDRLLFTTSGASGDHAVVYSIDRAGQLIKLADIGGKLAVSRERVFVYNPTGLYRLNEATRAAELLLPLDGANFTDGEIVTAYDGTLIIAHHSYADRRLIVLNLDGSLRWDRSVQGLGRSLPQLIMISRRMYAITSTGDVLLIDLTTSDSQRVFDGGAPTFLSGQMWAQALPNGRLAFDFRGGRLIVLDPRAALPVVEVDP